MNSHSAHPDEQDLATWWFEPHSDTPAPGAMRRQQRQQQAPPEPGPTELGFRVGLFQEHLQEVVFLLTECKEAFDLPEVSWGDIASYEDRLEQHLDALRLGGHLAMECAWGMLADTDNETLSGAAFCLASVGSSDDLEDLAVYVLEADADQARAIGVGLKHAQRDVLAAVLTPLLLAPRPPIVAMALEVGAYRRELSVDAIAELSDDTTPAVRLAVLRALQSSYVPEAWDHLVAALRDEQEAIRREAAGALVKYGSTEAVDWLLATVAVDGPRDWLVRLLGATGDPRAASRLIAVAPADKTSPAVVQALARLGFRDAIDYLVAAMHEADEALRLIVAHSLQLFTGAGLRETVEQTEALAADELLPGEPPPPPRTELVQRWSCDPDGWAAWWSQHDAQFAAGRRYRFGKPFKFPMVVQELAAPGGTAASRRDAALEYAFSNGAPLPFEVDWWSTAQRSHLQELLDDSE